MVTPVSPAPEARRVWTAVTGPEGNLETPATGSGRPDLLDILGRAGRRVRKENLATSPITPSGVFQEHQEPAERLVSEVLMVRPVVSVPEGLTDTPVRLVLPDPRDQWEAAVTDIREKEETRVTWVFPDPAVLPATGR